MTDRRPLSVNEAYTAARITDAQADDALNAYGGIAGQWPQSTRERMKRALAVYREALVGEAA